MPAPTGFRLPRTLLPRPGTDLTKWAVIACDQYTAEPAYWQRVAGEVGDAPSTLQLIFPEVHLGSADAPVRIQRIQQAMRRYLEQGLLLEHDGAILVERRLGTHQVERTSGERTPGERVRRGLMLELDLEHYDFNAGSASLIRPTEGTIVARLAPRIEVRRAAELELPHVLVLIDDPQHTVIEPIAAEAAQLAPLYDCDLMLGGGHVRGYGVDAVRGARALRALQALAEPQAFAARYGVPPGSPVMLFAVGDGNHSLATAKSIWDQAKGRVGMDHPSRYALVEVENIHDPALAFAPIHRLLFGVTADLRQALAEAFGSRLRITEMDSAAAMRARVQAGAGERHVAGLIGAGARFAVVEVAEPPSTLAVGTFQAFVDRLMAQRGAAELDYVHGDDALERLATADGNIGLHLPVLGKRELLRMVVREGALPRKSFSMGEADEKRFYVEARRIRGPGDVAA